MVAGVSTTTVLLSNIFTTNVASTTKVAPAKYKFTKQLKTGSTGTEVSALQDILSYYGYYKFTSTGYFGPITKNAVIAFQKANTLYPYPGEVGPKTREVLNVLQFGANEISTLGVPTITTSNTTTYTSSTKSASKPKVTITAIPKDTTTATTTKSTPGFWNKVIRYIKSTYTNIDTIAPQTK